MKADRLKRYRFATEAQWDKCLFVQADRESLRKGQGVRPFAPYARPATLHASQRAHAPAVTRTREILWIDDACKINRLPLCNDVPETYAAPAAMARATRIVSTRSGLWVKGDSPDSLERYEEDTLTRLSRVKIPNVEIIDIASDGRDSIWALIRRSKPGNTNVQQPEESYQSIRIDRLGHVVETVNFRDISNPKAFVFLRRAKRFVVLAGDPYPRLYWFAAESDAAGFGVRASFSLGVAGMRPCFVAHALGSDSTEKAFLAGVDGKEFGGRPFVLIFDADGDLLGELPLDPADAPATGVAANRESLVVTGRRGLLQFKVADVVPEGAGQMQCSLMTPLLFSPDREDKRRWLRVEATASLPEGSTLEISWTATDNDAATRDRLNALASDDAMPASQVVASVLNEPDLRRGRTVFHGSAYSGETDAKQLFTAKLFDVKERYLWIFVTLTAATGVPLPVLSELVVLYPGRTLMEDLPAIYQKDEGEPDNFLRALVGVLETTTQGLDARIRSMGSNVHPLTATEPWLDFIARWLGVPWDDALTLDQKKAIVMKAPELAKNRGTRAGLEALLECVAPGSPRRFRVTDATADFGFAIVGGGSCPGSTLPAMLGGLTRWSPELDSSAVLGYLRLPCPGQLDDGAWQLTGKIQVEVAATAAEQEAWSPWLLALITEMVPLTARVKLRWTTTHALRSNRLDDTLRLESAPEPHLGTDAITGLARFPEGGIRLSTCGATIGTRLR